MLKKILLLFRCARGLLIPRVHVLTDVDLFHIITVDFDAFLPSRRKTRWRQRSHHERARTQWHGGLGSPKNPGFQRSGLVAASSAAERDRNQQVPVQESMINGSMSRSGASEMLLCEHSSVWSRVVVKEDLRLRTIPSLLDVHFSPVSQQRWWSRFYCEIRSAEVPSSRRTDSITLQ